MADWAKYAQLHLGNNPALLPGPVLDFLHTPTAADPKYALGWIVTQRRWAGGTALTHAGSNTTFYSVIWLAPKKNFAVVVASNTGEEAGFDACDQVVGLMIRKYLKIEP
jgi:CubicO group peptidase (beta-lactamase class C family)